LKASKSALFAPVFAVIFATLFTPAFAGTFVDDAANLPRSLDDLMTPDQIAQELGIDPTQTAPETPGTRAKMANFDPHSWANAARIVVLVNKAETGLGAQRVTVYVDGVQTYVWKTSTGREKKEIAKNGDEYTTSTPIGFFRPQLLVRNHFSKKWQADMEWAVFFNGGIATHAAARYAIKDLGKRASGGCVRLHPDNAEILYDLIEKFGRDRAVQYNRWGKVLTDKKGNPIEKKTYSALFIVHEQKDI
jgi:lipoprotein-anchoring transpeptidase ErfK/SrfK